MVKNRKSNREHEKFTTTPPREWLAGGRNEKIKSDNTR